MQTYANALFVTWTGTGAVVASTTLEDSSYSSFPSSLTISDTQPIPTFSSIGLNAPSAVYTALPHHSSYAPFSSTTLHVSTLYDIPSPNMNRSFPERNIAPVVVPLVLALLSAAAFVFHLVRKRRTRKARSAGREAYHPAEPQMNSTELGGVPIHELQSPSGAFELHGSEPRKELQ